MVGHAHWSERIDDLVTGELPEGQREELERHLSSCEACQAELDALRALRGATRQLAATAAVPAGLDADVRAALDGAPRVSPRPARSRGTWLAVAAAVMIAAAAAVWFQAPASEDLPGAAIRSYQLHRVGQLPLAIEAVDEEVLQGFFERQLEFPARVIDLRMMEYALIGGRVHELQGRPTALYTYRGPDGRIVLCQMLLGTLEELPPADETYEERGFTFRVYRRGERTAVFWLEGQVLCILVSDMPAPELLALAREKAMA